MQIGIIGAGLIGSSLARDFMENEVGTVHIYDRNPEILSTARSLRVGHAWHDTAAGLAAIADIVILCVPVRRMGDVATEIAPHLRPGTIVTDVGSSKIAVIESVRAALPAHAHFVAGHPAAGSEKAGPAAGRSGMFAGKVYILCPDDRTDPGALEKVTDLIGQTGARIMLLDAATHDRIFAFTSHMPHVLAFAAMNCTPAISSAAGCDVLPYAGSSYRDWTRVAGADPVMWRDIFLANAAAIQFSLREYMAEISRLSALIDARDEDGLMAYITASGKARAAMDDLLGEKE